MPPTAGFRAISMCRCSSEAPPEDAPTGAPMSTRKKPDLILEICCRTERFDADEILDRAAKIARQRGYNCCVGPVTIQLSAHTIGLHVRVYIEHGAGCSVRKL